MERIVFVNLHANPMLVILLEKFIFKQSYAVKHKYLLDYLINNPNFEVCSYINEHGFSMANNLPAPIMKFLNMFRFAEHKIVMKKNGIPLEAVKVLRSPQEIRKTDIVIAYRHCGSSLYELDGIKAFRAISMIHFWGKRQESELLESINPDILFCESDLKNHSEIFQRYYGWYDKDFLVHPFVYAPRFKRIKSFSKRKNKAFATGTITYKEDPDFLEVYESPCDQPSRKQIKDNIKELEDLIYCTSSDYSENAKKVVLKYDNAFTRFYRALHYKLYESQQKSYYSFDMVQSFNDYKMCIVGEEILGVPGIGFVEGMACGCAYIGQDKGYYEDYGMTAGVNYISYDGTLKDLAAKIRYYQAPEHQDELEKIADAGYDFAQQHFCGRVVATELLSKLINERNSWIENHRNEYFK